MKLNVKNIYDWPLTTRLLIALLVGALAFYMGYMWDLSSLKTELTVTQQQEQDLKQQIELLVHKEAGLKIEVSQFADLKALMAEWQTKLVQRTNLPELLNEILKIGGNNHLYFSSFDPQGEVEDNGYTKVPIKMVAVGSYHQIASFISQVANMASIVVISDFIISNENKSEILGDKLAKEANAANLLTATILLEVYLAEKKPAPPPVKEKGKKPSPTEGATPAPQTTPTAPESTTNAH